MKYSILIALLCTNTSAVKLYNRKMIQKESRYITDTLKDMISHEPEVVSL